MDYIKMLCLPVTVIGFLLMGCEQPMVSPDQSSPGEIGKVLNKAPGKGAPEGLVFNEFNGNYYSAVEAPGITWADANAAAEGMSFGKCVSHLATVTSQDENDWIAAEFPEAIDLGYWLGGQQEEGAAEPAGGWGWVTGEPWIYTNWAGGEPNDFFDPNDDFNEESLHFFPPFFGPAVPGTWNDQNGEASASIGGYVVEYECPTKVTGGGQVLRRTGDGSLFQRRVYGFNSHKDSDTSVKGQAQGVLKTDGGPDVSFHMDITCQSIWGNEVWLGGLVRQSNDPVVPEGRTFLWRFEDNGQGKAAASDRVSFYVSFGDDTPIDTRCALNPRGGAVETVFELEKGNIKIHK